MISFGVIVPALGLAVALDKLTIKPSIQTTCFVLLSLYSLQYHIITPQFKSLVLCCYLYIPDNITSSSLRYPQFKQLVLRCYLYIPYNITSSPLRYPPVPSDEKNRYEKVELTYVL